MCTCNTEVADNAIQKLIADLADSVGRLLTDDDKVISRIALLRASMNPIIVTEK